MPARSRGPADSTTRWSIGIALLLVAVLLGFAALRPENSAAGPAATTEPVVAFLGDSYTAGAGASPGRAWPHLLATALGWDSYQSFAHGGTGYATAVTGNAVHACGLDFCPRYDEVLPRVIDYAPTLVIVSGGRNDTGRTPEQVAAGARKLLGGLSTALPEATVVVTSPIWDARPRPATLDELAAAIRRAAAESNATYLDLGEPFAGKPQLITADQVHPNDAGYELLARAVAAKLTEAGITP